MSELSRDAHPASGVAARREQLGLSQAVLACRAGVSRATVSAVELGKASPSVTAALALASALDASVEELFGNRRDDDHDISWVWSPPAGENRAWEVCDPTRGRRLYPVEALDLNPLPHDMVLGSAGLVRREGTPPPTLTLATCDPAARVLANAFEDVVGVRMLCFPRSSQLALELLGQDRVDLAGVHAATVEDPEANVRRVRELLGPGWLLVRAAGWESGIVSRDASRRWLHPRQPSPRCQWAMRESGSVARDTLDQLLEGAPAMGREVAGHRQAAEAVGAGWADAAVTLRLCAAGLGLPFTRLRNELIDLVFPAARLSDRRFRNLVALLQSAAWRQLASDLPGYDGRDAGAVFQT